MYLFLFSCSIPVSLIKKGRKLNYAEKASVDLFLNKRMENKIKKTIGCNWEILLTKNNYVYWGWPNLSNKKIKKRNFFKTSLQELESNLPDYQKLDGIYIFNLIKKGIEKKLIPKIEGYTLGDVKKKYKYVSFDKEKQEIKIIASITWGSSWENKNELIIILNSKNIDEIKEIKIQ